MQYAIDVLMQGKSQYEVLNHFTIAIAESLKRLGHNVRLLSGDEIFVKSMETPPDFTIGFNGALSNELQNEFWPDVIKVPHVSCLLDPPYQFLGLEKCKHLIITCDDRFIGQVFKGNLFPHAFFIPHACETDLVSGLDTEKKYDVVLLASLHDYEVREERWKEKYPKRVYTILMEAVRLTLADETTSFMKAFEIAFNEEAAQKSDDPDLQAVNMIDLLKELEAYLKGIERVKMVKAINDAEVHIFGSQELNCGKKYFKDQANVILHDPVTFNESIKIMQQSRIALNSSIKNKEGGHERIFYGLASGALVVTNENSWLKETFEDGKNILFYRYRELDKLNDQVNAYLADEPKRRAIAESGRQTVMKYHTWDIRMANLLQNIAPILTEFQSRKF